MENLSEVKEFYEKNIYGVWREEEKVSYSIHRVSLRENIADSSNPMAALFKLSTTDEGIDVEITVEKNGRAGSFVVRAYLPPAEKRGENGCPFIVCMHPVMPKDYALEQGIAMIFMDTSMVAEDNDLRKGCFYDIYPYGKEQKSQTGVLMAWAW